MFRLSDEHQQIVDTVRKVAEKEVAPRAREIDEVHIWHFGDDGLVTRFRHRADTLKQLRAWQGASES